ncbi:hypothetical protein AB0I81_63585 [Nonomuraea sp. NPDC050404]|uniref:hypothetical protein n=1 Tax=Nonomuraea sp. NPDC050404 TaxID=3155783 RepID=UPI0033E2F503
MAIEWKHLEQKRFDRIVESIIHRMYSGTATVEVLDGRGGDGGRDIVVTQGSRLRIFQLKFFPEGFPKENRSRRRQIKDSFVRAMAYSPYEWTLVVPCNLTPSEQEFIDELVAGHDVRVSVMGRVELDAKMIDLPDLESYYQRDLLIEDAKILNHERTLLLGGPGDLDRRVINLGKVVDQCDEDWTFNFSRKGDKVFRTLRAKHPRAHVTSPVHITVEHSLIEDSELSRQIQRTFGYGTDEKVVLPAEIVERLTVKGPEWLSETVEHVDVELLPNTATGDQEVLIELRILDDNSDLLASHHGRLQHGNAGYEGRCLKATFHNVAKLTILLPYDEEQSSSLSYEYQVDGASPADLLRAMRLIKQLHQKCTGEIYLNGQRLGVIGLKAKDHSHEARAHLEEVRRCEQLAEDLDIVQRHCDNFFPVPAQLSGVERAALRMARLLVDGKCAIHPMARTLTAALTGSDGKELRLILSGKPQSIRVDLSGCVMEIAGHELVIGDVMLFHTRVIAVNADQVTKALDSRSAENSVLKLQPEGDEHFHAFIPAKWPSDSMPVVPTPWGLPELKEPGAQRASAA